MASDDLYRTDDEPAESRVMSVSELTGEIKGTLEGRFASVWISGEISNLSRPQSGHCYLTLKDDAAQIRAVLWRTVAQRTRVDLHDGLEVICQGYVDVYPPRGSYQLVIQQIEAKGLGALERALRLLRERLAAEGLFEPARNGPCRVFRAASRSLPARPARRCAIFSKSCAAAGATCT